jgi:hypothetical protein
VGPITGSPGAGNPSHPAIRTARTPFGRRHEIDTRPIHARQIFAARFARTSRVAAPESANALVSNESGNALVSNESANALVSNESANALVAHESANALVAHESANALVSESTRFSFHEGTFLSGRSV